MRKLMMITLVLLLAASFMVIMTHGALAQQGPNITLSPTVGFSSVTISGTGFSVWNGMTIYWDGNQIPAVIDTDGESNFTAIISVPTQTSLGIHTVTAVDGYKAEANAQFRVVDMIGPAGPAGMSVTGMPGEDGISCWDLNQNGSADAAEDVNSDGAVNVLDCQGSSGDPIVSECDCPAGPAGPAGADGTDGTDGLSISWMGEWSADEDYSTNDTVIYEGSAYIAIAASSDENPAEASSTWSLMAVRGEDGEPGEEGEQGEAGGGGNVGTTGFFLGLIALLLIIASKLKGWVGL